MTHTPARSARSPLVVAAIVIWSLAFLGLCGRTLLLKVDRHSVYPVFTSAADNWLHGEPLYVRGGAEEFRYSPLVAAFFVPFDLLPDRIGQFFWRSLNFSVFLAGLFYCCQAGLPRKLSVNQKGVIFLLVLPLSLGSLNNAQSNPLVIGLLLISIAAVMQKKWTLSAVVVTIATLFKLYPVAVGLLLVLLYPRRFTWRFVVCLLAGALLPFVLQRAGYVIDQYATWASYLSSEDRQRGPITDWYRDFRSVWRIYVAPMSARRYLIVEVAAAALIALVCLIARLRNMPQHRLLALMLSLACCWMTALGPATESATYILLGPAVAWALIESNAKASTGRVSRIAYGLVFGLFLVSQLALNAGSRGKWMRDNLQPLPIAGMLLFVTLLADSLRPKMYEPDIPDEPIQPGTPT